jgi:hypothetical protein
MDNLDDLAAANPKKAVELITNLADKLNEMSDNSVSLDFVKFNTFFFGIDFSSRYE